MGTFMMLGAIVLIFYFFMIRPQMKKSKAQKKFKEHLKKGDKIITIGGIHGKIAEMKETTLIIDVEGGNRLKIEKSAVSMESSDQLKK
ncbi:MAG: preprotein translocase subunit YajC [Bacteroidota bacterium]